MNLFTVQGNMSDKCESNFLSVGGADPGTNRKVAQDDQPDGRARDPYGGTEESHQEAPRATRRGRDDTGGGWFYRVGWRRIEMDVEKAPHYGQDVVPIIYKSDSGETT